MDIINDIFAHNDLSKDDNLIEARARRAGLKLIDETDPTWQSMNPLQKGGAQRAQGSLLQGYEEHKLAPVHFQGKVLDFGCGVGGSTYVLSHNATEVTAVDKSEILTELRVLGLPNVSIVDGDGIALMAQTPDNTYDMVVAYMLGPDDRGDFIDAFYTQANRIINPNGRILVTSDGNTMHLLIGKYGGNYGGSIPQSNIFIGRKNPVIH
ncbi:class I SAM-dependent methyltransferase [Candidatus Roizmanbacteria bacterium]|nr:class I SAM-dependent methyltransferase [Candidatus Roizmanbacteria bacterium]